MGLLGFNSIGKSIEDAGSFHYQYFYKSSTPSAGAARYFIDCNQTSGQPKYNPFAGSELTATPLVGSGNSGIYCGTFEVEKSKFISKITLNQSNTTAASPNFIFLNDYLMFYPLIDCDNLDAQIMDNTNTLPRYQGGEGVRIVLVGTAPMTSIVSVTVTYTNSDGVSGRTSTADIIPSTAIGVCATAAGSGGTTSQSTPFWPLADGDKGVRSIESIQFAASAGGFLCACLVKPITQIMSYEDNVPVESQSGFSILNPPQIYEGAYLNFLIFRGGGGSPLNIQGEIIFINS